MARWRRGNAVVCKTTMHRFKSGPGLKVGGLGKRFMARVLNPDDAVGWQSG